jgi:hypothetical protein
MVDGIQVEALRVAGGRKEGRKAVEGEGAISQKIGKAAV